jgi:hypothetical protein
VRLFRHVLIFGSLAVALGSAGCGEEPKITTQEVPRLNTMQRLWGAIVFPQGEASEKIWFFKVLGPELAVADHKESLDQFLQTVRFNDNKEPTWKLPGNWTLEPKDKEERFATIKLPSKGKGLELTVTGLSMAKSIEEALFGNINRWRGQLGLHAVGLGEMGFFFEEFSLGEAKAFLVDMVGHQARQAPPMKAAKKEKPFHYEVPTGWQEAPPTQFSELTFEIKEGTKKARFTLSLVGGGVIDNLNRWRGQVKLPPSPEGQVLRDTKDITVGGKPAKFVDLIGPDPTQPGGNRIMGAIYQQGGENWYFKLHGPEELVGRQKKSFEEFLKSFKFSE